MQLFFLFSILILEVFMRIIAGKHKGLNLYTFEADNIRPTADRVREGIFNKLQFIIADSKILDLFGGTGAIGIEFLSRGASSVIECDNNKNSIELIKKNYTKAKEELKLISKDYLDALIELKNFKFDIIFLDPPFASDFGEKAIKKIVAYGMLSEDGIIVYEHDAKKTFINENCDIFDSKKYGTILVDYLRVKDV